MGGVDVSDKSIYHTSCTRPTKRYWKRIFYNLLDNALFNSYVLYSLNTDKPKSRKDYLVDIVETLAHTRDIGPTAGPSGDTAHQMQQTNQTKYVLYAAESLHTGVQAAM